MNGEIGNRKKDIERIEENGYSYLKWCKICLNYIRGYHVHSTEDSSQEMWEIEDKNE